MEGPLVSDTTELLSGAPGVSEDAPVGTSAPSAASGASTSKSRSRGGAGLSSLLMPELQRMAQSLGIPGAGRMRKGQLVEAIEARQGGSPKPEAGAANQGSDQRVASAGADATRLRKQDAMDPDTGTQPGIGDGAATGIGTAARGQDGRNRCRRGRAAAQLRPGGRPPTGRTAGPGGLRPGRPPSRTQRSRLRPSRERLSRPRPSRAWLQPRRPRLSRRPARTRPVRRRALVRTASPARARRARPSAATGGAGTGAGRTSPSRQPGPGPRQPRRGPGRDSRGQPRQP